MKELNKIPRNKYWGRKGIKKLSQVLGERRIKSFQQLQEEFKLEDNEYFQYVRISHALKAQGKSTQFIIWTCAQMDDILKGAKQKQE